MPKTEIGGRQTSIPVVAIVVTTVIAITGFVGYTTRSNVDTSTFVTPVGANPTAVATPQPTVIETPTPAPPEPAGAAAASSEQGTRRDRARDEAAEATTPADLTTAAEVPQAVPPTAPPTPVPTVTPTPVPTVTPQPTPAATPTPQIDPGAPQPCPNAEPNSTLATAIRIELAPNTERTCEVVLVGGEDRDIFTIAEVRAGDVFTAHAAGLDPDRFELGIRDRDGQPRWSTAEDIYLPDEIAIWVQVDGPISVTLQPAGFVRRDLEEEPVHSSATQETIRLTLKRRAPTPTPAPSPTPLPTATAQPYVDDYDEPDCYWKGGNEHDPDDGYIWCE